MSNIFSRKSSNLEDVYEILFKEHYSSVYRILYAKFNNHEISEDAAQEAFHVAFGKLNQLKDKNKFFSWVLRIAINKANDFIEKNSSLNVVYLEDSIRVDTRSALDFNSIEDKDEINRILSKVKPDEREILILKYYLDMSMEEIAASIQVSPANAKSKLHRARENYKKAAGIIEEQPPSLKGGAEHGHL